MIDVADLNEGIVIDHIKKGQGYKIFSQLGLDKLDDVVLLMRNVPSKKTGQKDVIKIETDLDLDLDVLGLIDPGVTVNYIKNGQIVQKLRLSLPQSVEGILECKNPRCISKTEHIEKIKFYLFDEPKRLYRCEFCDSLTEL